MVVGGIDTRALEGCAIQDLATGIDARIVAADISRTRHTGHRVAIQINGRELPAAITPNAHAELSSARRRVERFESHMARAADWRNPEGVIYHSVRDAGRRRARAREQLNPGARIVAPNTERILVRNSRTADRSPKNRL